MKHEEHAPKSLTVTPWLVRAHARPKAVARLYCFPHAGVGASAYRAWSSAAPEHVEIVSVLLPGRESRLREAPISRIPALVERLLPELAPNLSVPYAFFGHSMGAVLAFETARALVQSGLTPPEHLFVSSRRPPRVPDIDPPMRHLSDADFVTELLRRYGGIPAEVLEHPDLLALLLPGLRADIEALETHGHVSGPTLGIPVTAFGGVEDRRVPLDQLEAWRGETTGPFRIRQFPGGHFYVTAQRSELLAEIVDVLTREGAGNLGQGAPR